MTAVDGHARQKRFEQWRAGLLEAAPADIEQHLDALRIIEQAPGTSRPLPPRPLSELEKEAYREGRLSHAEIVRAEVLAERNAKNAALERSSSMRRAERAASEAARLAREAKRFG